jgi:hypothetical protein
VIGSQIPELGAHAAFCFRQLRKDLLVRTSASFSDRITQIIVVDHIVP